MKKQWLILLACTVVSNGFGAKRCSIVGYKSDQHRTFCLKEMKQNMKWMAKGSRFNAKKYLDHYSDTIDICVKDGKPIGLASLGPKNYL